MPLLKFEVQADYDKVIKLREEINRLESALQNLSPNTAAPAIGKLENQLADARQQFNALAGAAAVAGAEIQDGFRKKIYNAAQDVNGFTDTIIAQKGYIHGLQSELRKLTLELGELGKAPSGGDYFRAKELKARILELKTQIGEEKDALFDLTQEQAKAKLTVKELTDEYNSLKKESGDTTDIMAGLKGSIRSVALEAAGIVGIGTGLKEIISQTVKTRGEFQQLEVAFKTMLKDGEAANDLMAQLTRTAAITPFDLQGVADGAKQLLAYGVSAGEVNDTLTRLGDIAAGLSLPLNDLVYLYGTTITQGRLYTQDLRQFMGRGIPLAEELAKQFGVTKDKVGELVTAGKVGADEFKRAMQSMTDAGSAFGGLMEAQSATFNGQISNIEDAVASMFNEIGKNSEGIINGTLGVISDLVESYERVGRVLLATAAAVGIYKTACILAAASTKGWTAVQLIAHNRLLLMEKAQRLLNATMLANPYVLAAVALGTLVVALASAKTESEKLKEAEEKYQSQLKEVIEAEKEHKRRMEELCAVAGDETASTKLRREALYQLEKKYPDIFAKYDTELEKLNNIAKIKKEIAELDGKTSLANPENELKAVQSRVSELRGKKSTEVTHVDLKTGRTFTTGGLNYDEKIELKNLEQKLKELEKQVRKNEQDKYILNLSERIKDASGAETDKYKVSDSELANKLSVVSDLINKLTLKGDANAKGRIKGGELDGMYTKSELEAMKSRLEAEQKRRATKGKSSSTIVAELKKAYDDATKAYNDFVTEKGNELQKDEFEKRAKELKDAADAAKKEYDKYKPDTKAGSAAAKETGDRDALNRQLKDLEDRNQKALTDLLEEGREKRLRIIQQEYDDRIKVTTRQKEDWVKANKKAKVSDTGEDGLTAEQSAAIKESERIADEQRKKAVTGLYREEAAAMRDYLKDYGTYQQQKLAITQEYAEKIKQAASEGEKLKLEQERDAAVRGVDMSAIKSEIDWKGLFSGVGTLVSDQFKPMFDRLNALTKSDEFQQYTLEDRQQIYEWISELQQRLGGDLKKSFESVGAATEKYRKALQAEEEAKKEAEAATLAYQSLLREKSEDGVADPEDPELKAAFAAMVAAGNTLKAATNNTATALGEVTDAAQSARVGMSNLVEGLQKLGSGSVSGAMDGLGQLLKTFKGNDFNLNDRIAKWASNLFPENDKKAQNAIVGALQLAGSALGGSAGGAIIELIFSLLDIFKDGIENLIASLIDSILGAINGILHTLLSFDLPLAIGKALMNGLKSIIDTLTFGGFSSWIGGKESDKHYERDMERLSASNEKLSSALDRLSKVMDDAALSDVGKIADTQREFLNAQEANLSEQIRRSGQAYKSDNIFGNGGEDSGTYYLREMDKGKWQQIAQLVGKDGEWGKWIDKFAKGDKKNLANAFLDLSAEDMKKVADELPSIWIEITDRLSKGHKDATQYLEDYIAIPDMLKEIEDEAAAKYTDTTFDSVADSFKSMLLDMESDSDDFMNNFEEGLQQAVINSMMSENYSKRLKQWYDNFAEAMSDSSISADEKAALQEEYDSIVNDALAERDALKSAFGWGSATEQQNATAGYSTQLSEDTGSEMVGRMTAIQDAMYRLENLAIERNKLLGAENDEKRLSLAEITNSQLTEMVAQQSACYNVHIETRRILAECYLELQQIRENTAAVIKPISSIKDSVEKIEKNIKDVL